MEEQTTTNAPVDDGGSTQSIAGVPVDDQGMALTEEPQPEQQEQAEAVAPETTEQPEEKPEVTSEPAVEADQLADWASKKGLTLDSDNARKAAEMARNAEKAMHEKAQKASELEKVAKITEDQVPVDATPAQKDDIRVRNLELKFAVQDWKSSNPGKLAHEAEMVQVLADPVKKALVQDGYLSLDDVYNIAVGSNPDTLESVKSQGKKEALQTLAQKQQAAVPTGNAVNPSGTGSSSTITPQNVDSLVKGMSTEEYQRRLPEINKALAG